MKKTQIPSVLQGTLQITSQGADLMGNIGEGQESWLPEAAIFPSGIANSKIPWTRCVQHKENFLKKFSELLPDLTLLFYQIEP